MSLATVNHTGFRVLTGLTALGSSQTTAYALVPGAAHEFTTVASSTGAILPVPPKGPPVTVVVTNAGSNTLSVYPPVGGTAAGGGANVAYSLTAGSTAEFFASSLLNYYLVANSAGAGGGGITGLTGDVITAAGSSGATAATFAGQTTVAAATISASQNNYSPTGYLTTGVLTANVLRLTISTGGDIQITGLVAPTTPAEGAIVTIENSSASTNTLHLVTGSASSTAANRFGFPNDVIVNPSDSITLKYDGTLAEWRTLGRCPELRADLFGSGYDGAVTWGAGVAVSPLTRDIYCTYLTVPASTSVNCAGFKVFAQWGADLSAASAPSFTNNGGTGTAGSGGTGGAGASASNGTSQTLPAQSGGGGGGNGATGAGGAGTAATARTTFNVVTGANGANGGAGASAAGGTVTGPTAVQGPLPLALANVMGTFNVNGVTDICYPGQGGSGGSAGGGDGTHKGGDGGGGGASGGAIALSSRFIYVGSNATASIIQAKGGTGGAGGNAATSGTNSGGGGGGGGGQGGYVAVICGGRGGTGGAGAIDVTGGTGGAGGTHLGTGSDGSGAQAGASGVAISWNLTQAVIAATSTSSAGTAGWFAGVTKVNSAGGTVGGVPTTATVGI